MNERARIETYARERARHYGVDENLIVRQIQQESGFNPRAVSPAGARGVMQLMPGTARDLGVNPDDWRSNVEGGVRYMAQQLQAFDGDTELALAAYNAGPGNARRRGKNWDQYAPETRDYVRIVGGSAPARESLTPGVDSVTPEWLRQHGIDPANFGTQDMLNLGYVPRDGKWVRAGADGPPPPSPLDAAYAERQEARESLALDQETASIMMAAQFDAGIDPLAQAVGVEAGADVSVGGKAPLDRSMGERLTDNIEQAFNLSAAGYLDRMLDPQNDGVDPVADFFLTPQILEGKPVDWVLDQLLGDNRGYLRSVNDETRRDAPMIAAERERRAEFADRSMRDPVRNLGDGMASLIGQFTGSALSPDSWVSPGKSILQRVMGNAAVAGGIDSAMQGADVGSGVQDEVNPLQTAGAAVTAGGLSFAGDLVGMAVRARRSAAASRGLQEDPVLAATEVAARGQEAQDAVRRALGNPAGARFRTLPEKIEEISKKTDRDVRRAPGDPFASSDNVFDINLARIETPDDVKAVIVSMADHMRKDVDLARRAQRSWDDTREASQGVDWVQAMAERRVGQAMNAEEVLAFRHALNASATKLLGLANEVTTNPTLANQYAFRRATATHSAIQNEFMGARAEAGRALNAFKIPTDAPATYLRQMDALIADAGGANSAQELARKLLDASKKGDGALNELVRGGALARTREMIKLVYTNGLLSGLGTPTINVAGNGMMLGLNLMTRALSPRMAGAFGGQASTKVGEAGAILNGYHQAVRDMFRLNPMEAAEQIAANGGEALRRDGVFRGMAPSLNDAIPPGIRLRNEREEAGMRTGRPLSAASWRVNEDSPLGRTLDILQMIMEAPSNINALTDDAFKTIAARGELHAQAYRKVASEGLDGDAARDRYADLIANPTDEMLAAAEREMHDLTFTRETPGMAETFANLRRTMDDNPTGVPVGTLLLPFIKTPANLISAGMRNSPLAPFSRRFRDALAEGGAAAETAKAQMALGSALWATWMGMAMDGDLTGAGPGNRGQREALQRTDEYGGSVFQPYSFRMGDRWVSYERLDPMGQGMALVADMADLAKNSDWDSDRNGEVDEVVSHGIMAMGQAFFDKTMLRSVMEIMGAMTDPTGAKAEKLLMNRTTGLVPFSSALRMTRRGEDPYLRETWNVASAIRNTIPGLSDDLPVQRDLWGKPRTYQTGLGTVYDAIVPVQTRAAGGSAIDLEILNNGVSVTMPNRSLEIGGENVSLKNRPDIYSDYIELAGQPAFEHLNAVATGQHPDSEFYLDLDGGPSGGKAEYIKDVISAYRKDARAIIIDRYASDLQEMAGVKARRREAIRLDE